MATPLELARLVVRQATDTPAATPEEDATSGTCATGNDYDGRMGVRISSIFVILIGSCLGAIFPVFARRSRGALKVPDWAFFIAKYFGSGVIIATAFIHLLAPANEALGDECLTGVISTETYPWPEAIALMMAFVMFFLELMTMRYAKFGEDAHAGHAHGPHPPADNRNTPSLDDRNKENPNDEGTDNHYTPGVDHLGHARDHRDNADIDEDWQRGGVVPETYSAQLTSIFILEFGVIFHSVFIGLTLAVAGDEFITLYIVLVFHQTFEGLGLGSRLATVPWPKTKKWTPYLLGLGYGLSTPLAIAIGLGVRKTYPPESRTTLITNGIFDSISAGILIYTGLVELMAHEFMFSPYMQKGPVSRTLWAFLLMVLGAGLMSLLGYWA